MKTTRIALLSLLALLLAACGSTGGGTRSQGFIDEIAWPWMVEECGRPPCVVVVTVTKVNPTTCVAVATPKFLRITAPGAAPVQWEMAGEREALFIDAETGLDGIKPKDPSKFDRRSHGNKRFVWHFKGSPRKEKYDVHTKIGTLTCVPLDPYIMN